jgi:hypothetical protein
MDDRRVFFEFVNYYHVVLDFENNVMVREPMKKSRGDTNHVLIAYHK